MLLSSVRAYGVEDQPDYLHDDEIVMFAAAVPDAADDEQDSARREGGGGLRMPVFCLLNVNASYCLV